MADPVDQDGPDLLRQPASDASPGPTVEAAAYSTGVIEARRHRQADARRALSEELERERRELTLQDFELARLSFLASWKGAALDPPSADDEPGYEEEDALEAALASLQGEKLPLSPTGKHMLFCRYSYAATKHQPAWVGIFGLDEARMVVVNADNARLIEMR